MAGNTYSRFTNTVGIKQGSPNDLFRMATSTYLSAKGGRFVLGSSGTFSLCDSSSTKVDGWVETCRKVAHDGNQGQTPYVTDGTVLEQLPGTKSIHTEENAFWVPVATGSTIDATYIGKVCDLAIEGSTTTTVQVVAIDVTTRSIVKIIGVDIVNNMALVYAVL